MKNAAIRRIDNESRHSNLPLMINGLYLWAVVSAMLLTVSSLDAQEDVKPGAKLTQLACGSCLL